ncbi:lactate racemase domain-containing protein [uncultured Dysosmobacter sp.]|uniref:lactate racemase domain-containing protein n=1 Tax=uncultured Dysosmobacter sp. TaxID=2591384 RepID=UPI00345D23D3
MGKAVIKELLDAGVPKDRIWFLAATGMHRAMGREEHIRKLGEELVREYRVFSHNPFHNNTFLGVSSSSIPIEVNIEVLRADYKVAIGGIAPHSAVGVAGGPKIVLPGICSADTIRTFHQLPQSGGLSTPRVESRRERQLLWWVSI